MRIGKIENGVITAIWEGDGVSTENVGTGTFVELPEGNHVVGDSLSTMGRVFLGSGIPNNKDGKNDHVYVDVDSGNVYRKQNNTWF